MPNIKAGKKSVTLTDSQLKRLGLTSKAEKLGCGKSACAYLPSPASDVVVKISKDADDALTAYILTQLACGQPKWSIPIHAVYRLPKNAYVLVTKKAEPIPEDLAAAFDDIYDKADDDVLDNWPEEYKKAAAFLKREDAKGEDVKVQQKALNAINEAVMGLRDLGLDWADFHSGNWMLYDGRPVVVDFGAMSQVDVDELPIENLKESKAVRKIPVLEF
jgi:hypothetical protein